jgi:carbonic anhydrase/acetyltransferase-like protein (isoleucine patch superfamily)
VLGNDVTIGARAVLEWHRGPAGLPPVDEMSIGDNTSIGIGSVLVGDIAVGHHAIIAVNCAIRGAHRIGNYVHIYDLVNIEGGRPFEDTGDRSIIEDYAWLNHGATMHGSIIRECGVLDINAALDYHCEIGKGAIVTNGSACSLGTVVPENCIAEGIPAKVVRENITDEDRRALMGLIPKKWVTEFKV